MSSNSSGKGSRFTRIVDLTTRGQEAAKQQEAKVAFAEPDPPLPAATIEALPPRVRAAVETAGWDSLMPVQQKAIPYILGGRDLIVQSRTGSGKTGAFLLPLFELLDPDRRGTQVLIMTPTRELARQIFEEFERMQQPDIPGALRATLVYGGVRYGPQFRDLEDGVQIVIGTPGRILDHLERGTFHLDDLRLLILDEADEMLSMGFYPAMRQLKRYLPAVRRSYMFSATMPPRVRALAREFLDDPGFLSLSVGQVGVDAIEHRYFKVDPMQKDRVLARIIEMENPESAIIFVNTKREVEYLSQFLQNYGYDADALSGDLNQRAREKVMARIRQGTLRFLVATDVAARGIDISDLSHVIMYDVPQDPEYYIHRSGRTARAGKTGVNLVLTTYEDERNLLAIIHRYDIHTERYPVPEQEDVEKRVAARITVVLEDMLRETPAPEREPLQQYVALVEQLARTKPELLALLVDNLYHELMHRPAGEPGPRRPEPRSGTAPEQVEDVLEELLRRKTNLERERLERFIPLVEDLSQEEPELFALLLHRLSPDVSAPQSSPSTDAPEKERRRPARRSGGRRSGGSRPGSGE